MAEEGQSEPLLPADQPGAAAGAVDAGSGGDISWLTTIMGFLFLTLNSVIAIYRSRGDRGAVAFVVFSYIDLVALLFCLRWFERALPGSGARRKRKVAVWVLATPLAVGFSYKVAAVMPVPVKVLLWLVAVTTFLGGFYAFFLHWKRKGQKKRGLALANLRLHSPQRAGGSSAHYLRDAALSGARFVVDSGATSHAVGNRWLLQSFQRYNPPLVATLADGSNLHISGIGHIQMGNFSIPNVFLVEGVQDGLISIPQLDTQHGLISCFGNGVCRIMEADGTEVGSAILEQDGSYVLRFLQVPGPAQV